MIARQQKNQYLVKGDQSPLHRSAASLYIIQYTVSILHPSSSILHLLAFIFHSNFLSHFPHFPINNNDNQSNHCSTTRHEVNSGPLLHAPPQPCSPNLAPPPPAPFSRQQAVFHHRTRGEVHPRRISITTPRLKEKREIL